MTFLGRSSERALALALVVALLAPAVQAISVVVPHGSAMRVDREDRLYVDVVAGNLDTSLGDLVVLTVKECADCPRDLVYRFMHAPMHTPTIANATDWAVGDDVEPSCANNPFTAVDACFEPDDGYVGEANACRKATVASTIPACLNPDDDPPGFADRDLAADPALDEYGARTDGRYVAYAVGAPGDVWRFDARRPDAAPVLVAGTSAHERPFGVAGEHVGVRQAVDATRDRLLLVNVATGATTVLATVNATDPASMTEAGPATQPEVRVAWAHQNKVYYRFDGGGVFESETGPKGLVIPSLSASSTRVSYVVARPCTAGAFYCHASGYNTTTYWRAFGKEAPAGAANEIDRDAFKTTRESPFRSWSTKLVTEVVQFRGATFVTRLDTTTGKESIAIFDDNFVGSDAAATFTGGGVVGPCGWDGLKAYDLGTVAPTFHYVFQLLGQPDACHAGDVRSSVKAYPATQCRTDTSQTNVANAIAGTRCYGMTSSFVPKDP